MTTLGLVGALHGTAPDSSELRREALMTALRAGGYTIVMRHAATDWTFNEDRTRVPPERSQQRNLTAEGVRQAKLMGSVLVRYHIPIGEIISSPMFRTRETAQFAAGTPTETMVLRTFPTTPEQAALLAVAPPPGRNRLIVTHHFVIEAHVPGIRPGDVQEGEAVVVKPDGPGRVALVGRITLADWESLANPGLATSRPPAASYPETAPAPGAHAAAIEVPATRAGRLARDYLEVFNSGDAERMAAWLDTNMANDPHRPTAERIATFRRLVDDFGRLVVTAVHRADDDQVDLGLATKQGSLTLTVTTMPEQPARARSITFTRRGSGH